MHSPAIQVALNNLVETIRTAMMAEFLELLRSGKPAKIPGKASKRTAGAAKKTAKKTAKKAPRRASR
jgi:hypothetical protein